MSTAYELARRHAGKIVVLEKGASVATGSTGASSACLRLRYSHTETMSMALYGQQRYRDWALYTGLESPRADLAQVGVLWMLGEDQATVEAERDRILDIGGAATVLDNAQLKGLFPSLSTCSIPVDFVAGTDHQCDQTGFFLFEPEGGYCTDPAGANQDLLDACGREGVDIRLRSLVTDLRTQGSRVVGVTLADGSTIDSAQIVNASGPWCNPINQMAGLEHKWSLTPTRIQVMLRATVEPFPEGLPMVADSAGGIYFRPESSGQQILAGSIRMEDEKEVISDPDAFRNNLDEERKITLLHALHHRLPGLEHRGKISGLAGMYTMTEQDVHPVLGPTHIDGFFVSNGYSGHGFKLGPAVGNLLAQIMTESVIEGDVVIPHEFLSIERDSLAVREKSVLA